MLRGSLTVQRCSACVVTCCAARAAVGELPPSALQPCAAVACAAQAGPHRARSTPLLPRRLILAKAREHPPASTARVWMKSAMVEREAGDAAAERSLLQVGWCRGCAMAGGGWRAVGDGGCCCMWPAAVRNTGAVWVVRQELCSRQRAQGRSLYQALAHHAKFADAVVP